MKFYATIFSLFLCSVVKAQKKFIRFTPSSFSNSFSANIPPVLSINPGDTISTETIDAMGYDKNGVKRQRGGNPLTGPFYINNAQQGDIIAVTLNKVLLNKNYAFTSEGIAGRSVTKNISKQFGKFRLIKWNLDTQNGYAYTTDSIYQNIKEYKVPLNPFLGCIGVAPSNKKNEILSFFQGDFGGNLDFSSINQGTTVYLPVLHDGALLYFGDGHALQGDGELAGNALETSMDIEFTVQLIKKPANQLTHPRVTNAEYNMAIGTSKNIDDALKMATEELIKWLQQDYKLTIQEAAQVISTSIEYRVAEIADPNVAIVAKIKRELLKNLVPNK